MKLPTIKDIASLIKALKPTIYDDYRAYPCEGRPMDEEESIPSMLLTVGCDPSTGNWNYQTGDNSYMGGAYHYDCWGQAAIYRRSNSRELAREIIAEIAEQYQA